MRKKLLSILLLFPLLVSAIPAMKKWKTVTLVDGSVQQVTLLGDEHNHYYLTKDGKKVIYKEGVYTFLEPTTVSYSKYKAAKAFASSSQLSVANAAKSKSFSSKRKAISSSFTGKKKGLIILVEFSDSKFSNKNTNALYNSIVNEEGYVSDFGTKGSVHDYFYDQSYGKFDLEFDVVGPLTLEHSYAYYGKNETATYENKEYDLDDVHSGRMIVEACQAADSQVDFSDYDWDGDGKVDQVFVLYAGQGEASGGDESTVWPHEYELSGCAISETIDSVSKANSSASSSSWGSIGGGRGPRGGNSGSTADVNAIYRYFLNYYNVVLDGVTIDTYACSNEIYKEGRTTYLMGIGTICHEFAHCLGFPDTYDTAGENFGMGYWDLMDAGSYNGPYGLGWKPSGMTSWEKNYAGWLDFSTLSDNDSIKAMSALANEAVAYKITNPGNSNEYYLLENRQQTGWDEYTPGNGLLAIHVDYDKDIWDYNVVNVTESDEEDEVTNDHQRMTILHADNSEKMRTYANVPIADEANDVFTSGNLTDDTTPAMTLYNENTDGTYYLHARVMDIQLNEDGTMAFNYNPIGNTSSISSLASNSKDEVESVYDLNGRKIEVNLDRLGKGIYIIRYKSGDCKKVAIK